MEIAMEEALLRTLDTPATSGGSFLSTLPMLLAFVAIFYFIVLRPQQTEAKEHAKLVASLQKGDKVVTAGGVHGRVHEAKSDTLVLEISPNAFMTVDREVVKRKIAPTDPAKTEVKTDGTKGA